MKSLTDNELREMIRGQRLKVAGLFRSSARDMFMPSEGQATLRKFGDTIAQCCSRAETFSLHKSDPAQDRLSARKRCRNRHCPFCHAVDGSRVAATLVEIFTDELTKGAQLAMLTLTVRHKKGESTKLIRKDLDKAWFAFTKRAPFKAIICDGAKGGAYHRVAECELSRANGPHPHFHLAVKLRAEALKPYLQAAWREGRLHKLPLWRVYKRYCKENGIPTNEARFVTMPPTLLEAMLRADWLKVTGKLGRPSFAVRLTMIRPGKKPGFVQKRWRDAQGKPRKIEITIEKLVREFTKYITKRQATGRKQGQLGLLEYNPHQLLDYVRGLKNWHMHQSSANWAAAAEAAQQEDALLAEAEDAANECRTISYLDLVRQAQLAVEGKLNEDGLHQFEQDGLRCLKLLEKDSDNDQQQTLALRSHLAFCFGDDQTPVIAFPLATSDVMRALNKHADADFRERLLRNQAQQIEEYRERVTLREMADREASDRLADREAQRYAGQQRDLLETFRT